MLTRRDLTQLFIKVFGLLILVSAAIELPSTVYRFALQMSGWETAKVAYGLPTARMVGASYLGPIAAYVVVGLSFLWWSGRIVDRTSQTPDENDTPLALTDLHNVEVSLLAVIGLYFLADGVAELCRWIFSQGLNYGLGGSPTPVPLWTSLTLWGSVREIPWIMQALVKLTIGVSLVLGRGGAAALLRRSRAWVRKWRTWPHEPGPER